MFRTLMKSMLILSAIAFAASFSLSHVNKITKQKIDDRARQRKEDALSAVLPAALGYAIIEKDRKVVIDGREFFYSVAEKTEGDKKIKAFAFECEKSGYSGVIRSLVAVDETLKLIGISIIQQTETPGLGARSREIASSETFFGHFFGSSMDKAADTGVQQVQSWFEAQFSGIDAGRQILILKKGEWRTESSELKRELLEKNAVSAITGATITTRAVIAGIENGISALRKVLEQEAAVSMKAVAKK
jgi:electron transport complex protein RnfG